MADKAKIMGGTNDRPKNDTIAQTGRGLPDDSSRPVEVDDATVRRARESLQKNPGEKAKEDPQEKLEREVDAEIRSSEKGAE